MQLTWPNYLQEQYVFRKALVPDSERVKLTQKLMKHYVFLCEYTQNAGTISGMIQLCFILFPPVIADHTNRLLFSHKMNCAVTAKNTVCVCVCVVRFS